MSSGASTSEAAALPSPLVPPSVGRVFAQAKGWLTGLSRPARVLLITTVVAALALAGWLTWRTSTETWGPLFSQLERDDAAALVAKLKELKVPYRLQGDGTAIEVPEARVHELRLELASAGLPRGGGVGFESFDHMRLGATEFEQRVMFRRALEGELARSIGTLGAVQSARVHLVMSERSVFVSRNDPASASVVVRLRPGRSLGRGEVSGVVHLVASSVPALTAERITLVTTEGEMLHRPRTGAEDAEGSPEEDRAAKLRAMETSLEERTRAMLERVVGDGHVDVRASVEMDYSRVERTEDHYDRDRTALRSEQQTLEHIPPPESISLAGIPGAESNVGSAVPNAPPNPNEADAGNVLREQHTRNYEVDHVTERRVATQGSLKRLTVAVVVDGVVRSENGQARVVARDREELDRLTALVRGAVGASETRGDVVTVESIPFRETVEMPVARPAGRPAARPVPARRWTRLHTIAVGAVALALVLFAAVAMRRKKKEPVETLLDDSMAALPAPAEPEPVPALDPETVRENLRAEVHTRAAADPATAALVLRYWLGADDPDRPKA